MIREIGNTVKAQNPFSLFLLLFFALTLCLPGISPADGEKKFQYPVHKNITSTVFWVGERTRGKHDQSNNTMSAWDKHWVSHYGGIDTPHKRQGYTPKGFTPKENPFYIALPYNDFKGRRKRSAHKIVFWTKGKRWGSRECMCKNRWVKIMKNGRAAYAQWEDVGPFENDDAAYVFGTERPRNRHNHRAGIDVSPAVRDYLKLKDVDTIGWQFVPAREVPPGPWKEIVTTSLPCW